MFEEQFLQVVILLSAAIVAVAVFRRLNLSPVLGYFAAGGVIGPFGFAFIKDVEPTRYLAEFGVVFLLFYIGMELSLARLKAMRGQVFGFGGLQFLISAIVLGGITLLFDQSIETAIIVGGALALSSTAIVLQVIEEKKSQQSQFGRLSIAVLILQDLAVVPLLILVPLLSQEDASIVKTLADAFGKAILAMVGIFVVGRVVIRPLYHVIGLLKNQELFIATTLLIVLGSAFFTHHAGLSLALGAFIAGLLVAETEYRAQVVADIKPFKGLLLGLFFMTVGMSLDFNVLIQKAHWVLLLCLILIAVKALIIALLCRAFHFRLGSAIHVGLLLSQGGEFAFVLFHQATDFGVIPPEVGQILLVTVTVTMAITPLLEKLGAYIDRKITSDDVLESSAKDLGKETIDLEKHIIICGYGSQAHVLCKLLDRQDLRYVVVESNAGLVRQGKNDGITVFLGNAADPTVLKSLGIERARMLVTTMRDVYVSQQITRTARALSPELRIITLLNHHAVEEHHHQDDFSHHIAIPLEMGLMLSQSVLKHHDIPQEEINRLMDMFRSEWSKEPEKIG